MHVKLPCIQTCIFILWFACMIFFFVVSHFGGCAVMTLYKGFFWCICIPSDTEWKSELINSRNFDKEIGHQNPRYADKQFSTLMKSWLCSAHLFCLVPSAMAVEGVTVVAPEVRVGPFLLSKGIGHKSSTCKSAAMNQRGDRAVLRRFGGTD